MLTTTFIIIFTLMLWHFIYEAILAPTFRLTLKFNYDKLEDELFMLKLNHPDELRFEVFKLIEGEILDGKDSILNLNIYTAMLMSRKAKENAKIEELIKNRENLIDSCKLPQIKSIERNIIINFIKTIAINSGAWCIYIIFLGFPIAIFFLIILLIVLALFIVFKSIGSIRMILNRQYVNMKQLIKGQIIILVRSTNHKILNLNSFNEIMNSKLHQHC